MEDDKIKSLFAGFEPELTSDDQFMSSLERSLRSVDDVKRYARQARSMCRRAVAIAAVAGFGVGFVFSKALPYLSHYMSAWLLTLPDSAVAGAIAENSAIVMWAITATASVFAALSSFELSLAVMKSKTS